MTAKILTVQRFCLNDGPGIRTTVFFKGCPLHCRWCHNPESISFKSELLFELEKCVYCGKCAASCKTGAHLFEKGGHAVIRENCTLCNECVSVCRFGALEIAGKEATTEEIAAEVLKDLSFYKNSGGGVTLSGGEPMAQPRAATELLTKLKEKGVHTAVETSGAGEKEDYEKIAKVTDLFLYDLKLSTEELYREYTGGSLKTVLENLRLLNSLEKDIILRLPIIKGVNDNAAHFEFAAAIANSLPFVKGVEIMPYHSLGENKQKRLGKEAKGFPTPEKEEIEGYVKALSALCNKPVKRG